MNILTKMNVGRCKEYQVNLHLAFRHPAEAMGPSGEFLRIFDQNIPQSVLSTTVPGTA